MNGAYPGILHRLSPVTTWRGLQGLFNHYLDEATKLRAISEAEAAAKIRPGDYEKALREKRAPMRKGIDYVPRPGPNVTVHGYLREILAQRFPDPDTVPQAEMLDAVYKEWVNLACRRGDPHGAKRGDIVRKAIALVFSVNPAIAAELTRKGVPVDSFLASNIHTTLDAFGAQFYPGERIGWVAGAHHDRPHPHHHVLVFPYTSGGHRLNFSTLELVNVPGLGPTRIDYQGRLKQLYFEASQELYKNVGGGNELSEVDWNEAAADALVAVCASEHAARKAKGAPVDDEALAAATRDMERAPAADLLKSQQTLRNITRRSNLRPQIPGTRKLVQQASAALAERIDKLTREAQAHAEAQDAANQPLYSFKGPRGRPAYCPPDLVSQDLTEDTARQIVDALAEKQAAKLAALRATEGDLAPAGKASNPASILYRAHMSLAIASMAAGNARGYVPFFLREDVTPLVVTEAEHKRRFDEEFAEVLDRYHGQLKPFDPVRDGNKALSPYRESRREQRQAMAFDPSAEQADEPVFVRRPATPLPPSMDWAQIKEPEHEPAGPDLN